VTIAAAFTAPEQVVYSDNSQREEQQERAMLAAPDYLI